MNEQTVEAGCSKCNQRFLLPVVNGEPVWTHRCPGEIAEQRLKRIETMLEKLIKEKQ